MLRDGQRILDEPGDQVAVTGPRVCAGAQENQGGPFAQECGGPLDGVRVPFGKRDAPLRIPGMSG